MTSTAGLQRTMSYQLLGGGKSTLQAGQEGSRPHGTGAGGRASADLTPRGCRLWPEEEQVG